MRELFMRESNGIGFDLTRLTIAESDFSRRHDSLNDMPPGQTDPALTHFSLAPERDDVIPATKQALALNPEFYGAFANHLVR